MKRGSFAAGFLACLLVVGVTTTAYAAMIPAAYAVVVTPANSRQVRKPAAKLPRFMVCTSISFDGFMVSRILPCVKKSALIFQSGFSVTLR